MATVLIYLPDVDLGTTTMHHDATASRAHSLFKFRGGFKLEKNVFMLSADESVQSVGGNELWYVRAATLT